MEQKYGRLRGGIGKHTQLRSSDLTATLEEWWLDSDLCYVEMLCWRLFVCVHLDKLVLLVCTNENCHVGYLLAECGRRIAYNIDAGVHVHVNGTSSVLKAYGVCRVLAH